MARRNQRVRAAWLLWVGFAAVAFLPRASGQGAAPELAPIERGRTAVSADRCATMIGWLASPDREGRLPGTPQAAAVAEHIESVFRANGFVPPPSGSYRQRVPGAGPVRIGPATTVRVESGEAAWSLTVDEDFQPFAFSAQGTLVTARPVFVGYGISAPEWGYDDFAGVDVRGRVVIMMRHEPASDRPVTYAADPSRGAFFDGLESTDHATFTAKAMQAARHGAAGMILVNRPSSLNESVPDRLVAQHIGGGPDGLFALQVTMDEGDRLLRAGGSDETFASLEADINASQAPHSFTLGDALHLSITVDLEQADGENVIGVLPGRDPALRHQVVVIGAHRDHLGHGNFGSRDPHGPGQIHPGANDNGSGTTALIEIAHAFHAAGPARRTVVLAAFDAEERGLLGSRHYIVDPPFPLRDTVAMINMDMVGRYEDSLWWSGLASSPWWQETIEAACNGLDVGVSTGAGIVYASDNAPFYQAGIPAIFTAAGRDPNYHTPRDTVENVFPAGIAQVARAVFSLGWQVAEQPHRLPFSQYRRDTPEALRAMGITVDAAGQVPVGVFGVPLRQVPESSPAARAGLQPGDIVLAVNDVTCFDASGLAAMLSTANGEEEFRLTILRAGQQETLRLEAP